MLACERDQRAEEVSENVLLVGTQPSANDTLEAHLVNRLRHLLHAAASADSAEIATIITAEFKAIDMRVAQMKNSLVTPPWAEQLTYWQVLGGRLSDRLGDEYRAFDASFEGNSATVYASGISHDLWSAWSYRNGFWQAVALTIVPTASVRPSVAKTSAMDRRR
jgi:hypothetical protein